MTVTVVATFLLKPEHRLDGRDLIAGFIAPSLAQQGCLFYDLYQSNADPCEFVIVDAWQTQADLDAHAASAHVAETVSRLLPLLQSPPVVKSYTQLS